MTLLSLSLFSLLREFDFDPRYLFPQTIDFADQVLIFLVANFS
jgi:hypothetical protein